DVLRRLLAVYLHQDSSEDLRTKAKRALKSVIQKCTHLPALEPLLEAPPNILKYVVQQFAKVLPSDLNARKSFVQSGGLQKIQEVKAEVGSKLHDYIEEINMLYPPEIVQYYSPNYAETLLKKMEESQGAWECLGTSTHLGDPVQPLSWWLVPERNPQLHTSECDGLLAAVQNSNCSSCFTESSWCGAIRSATHVSSTGHKLEFRLLHRVLACWT
ncbi:SPAG6, partial [Symbiodinium necroappetens]